LRTDRLLAVVTVLLPLAAFGCRQGMYDQARYEPYEQSDLFHDGTSSRPLPAGTVARGMLRDDAAFYTGTTAGAAGTEVGAEGGAGTSFVTTNPLPVTREVLRRGRERYNVFCAPCHDQVGTGNGMIVQRGFTRAASFHEDRLRQMPEGYYYDVITRGFGQMPSYATQVAPEDRWAIVAYVRALQLSQNARLGELPADVRQLAEQALARDEPGFVPTEGEAGEGDVPGQEEAAAPRSQDFGSPASLPASSETAAEPMDEVDENR
jgi:mono/diheme cytochrome c family protein